ncbi:MAG: HAMP domain-containing histidine kinase [Actinomycetota bacterium]|nr:HAMP domain-containing histidine kinase [Actinomycetota bacterium]
MVIRDLSDSRRLEERQQRFIANAAHELRTPIGTIIGASELLLTVEEEGDPADPRTRRRFLGHINSQARRMQRLSDTLLRLARTGADFREPDLQEMELRFAEELVERVEPLVHGAGLKLCLEDRGGRALADPEWIEQALLILISNAVKHSERGGRIWLHARGGTLTMEDEGEGISEEDRRHVFERHYRGRGGFGGFGLGLPICKDLVERMGGEISIDSGKGVGTVVRIELPEARGPDG